MSTTFAPQAADSSSEEKPKFSLKELPNVVLGFFGIRTESELPHETRLEDGAFSIRTYPAHSEIRNEEVGSRKQAANKSFDHLFAYIQGQNWNEQTYAMTTPVINRPTGENRWATSFFLKPRIEELPLPKSSAVKLYAMNSETVAVIRFSGRLTDDSLRERTAQLREWMNRKNFYPAGQAFVAQYDQPFSIPFLKRNEILIPIESN